MESPAATASAAQIKRIQVLLPLPLGRVYDYQTGDDLVLEMGDIVTVPLGSREVVGVVWSVGAGDASVDETRLKNVVGRLDLPPLAPDLRRFVEWVASYTLSPLGAVLRMVLNVPAALEPARARLGLILTGTRPTRLSPARERVLAVVGAGPTAPVGDVAAAAGVSTGVVRGLIAAGALATQALAEKGMPSSVDPDRAAPVLSPTQAEAAAALRADASVARFAPSLLEGVTGAGKTEVYFEAIAATLKAGKQCAVLLPEIALTAQWLERFEARFGARPAEWHSDLRASERRRVWRSIAQGETRVVVGARSALFLPFPELGLIVVDEEHDQAFKQEEGVIYNARDMAIVRASIGEFPVVLVSATPSLETLANVEQGRYRHLRLPERHGAALLPQVAAIDMRRERLPATRWISTALEAAVKAAMAREEQAMLFLNRRGYAPLTLCRTCGHRLECPNCSAWLVDHRLTGRLQCHHCGYTASLPPACPSCGGSDTFAACGPGVERIAEEATTLFPEARIAVIASDTVQSPGEAADMVRRVDAREIDILVGTQLIAKGYHFPLLTVVGVIDADLGLGGGDLRASERTYQMLVQVSGRAGRAERPGHVLLQTYMPDHAVIRALVAGDRDGFLASEAAERRDHGLPPFGRLVAVIVSGSIETEASAAARTLAAAAPREEAGFRVLGPAPAPIALLRGSYRFRLLVIAERSVNVQRLMSRWIGQVALPPRVRVQVDVDPYSFL